ncbi:hypothetical protein [Kitasatospora sp. NPDC059673]|uniref:hypothetical protein n=1 Tax=Kitasatospora sp. NPDC059673 TaxID=3346901 RepID=UPI00367EA02B
MDSTVRHGRQLDTSAARHAQGPPTTRIPPTGTGNGTGTGTGTGTEAGRRTEQHP